MRQTARKSTCSFLSPRVREFPLGATIPDAYRQWKEGRQDEELRRWQALAQQQMDEIREQHAAAGLHVEADDQQEDSEEDHEEVELMQTDEQQEEQQEDP